MAYTTSHKNTNAMTQSVNANPCKEIARLGARMAEEEINILEVADDYVVYEFSYITDGKMKKWGKRIAPILDSVEETYSGVLFLVESEREALGQ